MDRREKRLRRTEKYKVGIDRSRESWDAERSREGWVGYKK